MIQKITFVLLLTSSLAFAEPAKTEGPCKQIKEACEAAGFAKGEAKKGTGLWVDCIDPIIKGSAQPKNATLKLPTIDASVVTACKAKHPNFGEGGKGKKGSN